MPKITADSFDSDNKSLGFQYSVTKTELIAIDDDHPEKEIIKVAIKDGDWQTAKLELMKIMCDGLTEKEKRTRISLKAVSL